MAALFEIMYTKYINVIILKDPPPLPDGATKTGRAVRGTYKSEKACFNPFSYR